MEIKFLIAGNFENIEHAYASCPQSTIEIVWLVLPVELPNDSICLTTSIPAVTKPKTTCLPSNQGVSTVVRKNWDPLELGPEFAIERIPGPVCFKRKFSS